MTKSEQIQQLRGRIDAIWLVRSAARFGPTFTKWEHETEMLIVEICGQDGTHVQELRTVSYHPPAPPTGHTDQGTDKAAAHAYEQGLENAKAILLSMLDEIQRRPDDADAC